VVALREIDVFFVENGGPLEGCSYTIIKLIIIYRSPGIVSTSELIDVQKEERERRTMLCLTSCAMAQLAVQRLLPAKLVLDLSTMTIGLVSNREILILFVDAVWSALLPLVDPFG
jgi:hypothetical protein